MWRFHQGKLTQSHIAICQVTIGPLSSLLDVASDLIPRWPTNAGHFGTWPRCSNFTYQCLYGLVVWNKSNHTTILVNWNTVIPGKAFCYKCLRTPSTLSCGHYKALMTCLKLVVPLPGQMQVVCDKENQTYQFLCRSATLKSPNQQSPWNVNSAWGNVWTVETILAYWGDGQTRNLEWIAGGGSGEPVERTCR